MSVRKIGFYGQLSPNVDKPSMIRWKQAKIHQERRERKDAIESFQLLLKGYDDYLNLLKAECADLNEAAKAIDIELILKVNRGILILILIYFLIKIMPF